MDSRILAVVLPITKPLPCDRPQPPLRVAGFPVTTKLEESSYIRRTFDHVNLVVETTAIIPNPGLTLKEHHKRAFREMREGQVHFGEAWVKDSQDLNAQIMNVDAHHGYFGHYYEGADGPVPDLQEFVAFSAAGDFSKSHQAGLPLSFEIRQQIYRDVVLADYRNPSALFNLASTCRFLRAEVISFHRANIALAFRHPDMLSQFLQYNEPSNVLLKHKRNMLTFNCVMIDLRSQLTSCPTKTMQICPDVKVKTCKKVCCAKRAKSQANAVQHDIFDKINLDILHLPASSNDTDPPDIKYAQSRIRFKLKQEPLPPDENPNTRRGIDHSTFQDWYEPMMKLLNGYKIQNLVFRHDSDNHDALLSSPRMIECLLGFSQRSDAISVLENVGGWAWDALQYEMDEEEGNKGVEEGENEDTEEGEHKQRRGFQKVWVREEEDGRYRAELDGAWRELIRRNRVRYFLRK